MNAPYGHSTYETWVMTLRAWGDDPERVSLSDLPPLGEDTFTPETYARFIDHLVTAMRQANDRWHEGLTRAWSTSTTPFDLAREMVSLRTTLARRLQLATHPSLPQAIQDPLKASLQSDIERYQREAEEAIASQRNAASLDTSWRDQMLQVVRENSFLAVLSYDASGDRPHSVALPDRHKDTPVVARSRTTRRIVNPPA